MNARDAGLHDCLHVFPGIVVELAPDGTVLDSNGHLERITERDITGMSLGAALDETSQEKLTRLLAADSTIQTGDRLELILVTPRTLDMRTLLVRRGGTPDESRLWLIEFVRDPELDYLHEELAAVNSDLISAQRSLTRQRAQLARSLAREQEARATAERATDRIAALLAITDAALQQLDMATLLERVLGILPGVLSADTASVLLVEEGTDELVVRASYGLEEEVARGTRLRIGEGVRGKVAATGEPFVARDLQDAHVVSAPLRERVASLMAAPLRVGDRTIGVVHVGTYETRDFSTDDVQFLVLVAERMASIIERARLHEAERAARATADAAVRVRDEVLGIVSHDLRNPLGAISTSASILLELSITDAQRQQQLQLIKRSAQRAARLIEDMLDVTRIEAVGLQMDRSPVAVPALVQEVYESYRAQAEEGEVDLRTHVPDDLPHVHADRDRILQLLTNLVGNAVKFTPRGGHVDVNAEVSGDDVVFTIRDTGIGIPADEIPHLFERYWQARRAQRSGAGSASPLRWPSPMHTGRHCACTARSVPARSSASGSASPDARWLIQAEPASSPARCGCVMHDLRARPCLRSMETPIHPSNPIGTMKTLLRCLLPLILLAQACTSGTVPGTPADLVILGTVWTGVPNAPLAEGVAVRRERIVAVGSDAEIRAMIGEGTRVIEAGDGLVTPGFIDTHVHFIDGGFRLASVQLRDAATPEEFIRRIAEFARTVPAGTWITGGDWDHQNWGGELPRRDWIDSVTVDHPVFVNRLDGHMALANSAAMRAAGVTRETADVDGGEIVRYADGEPAGVLKDNAMSLVGRAEPEPTQETLDRALDAAMRYVAEQGVTSVHNMGSWSDLATFERARERNQLRTRIYAAVPLSSWSRLRDTVAARNGSRGNEWLRIGGLKGFVDGSLGSRTAAFHDEFDDAPGNRGLLVNTPEELHRWIAGADSAGLHVMVHAIGDRANDMLLDIFARVQQESPDPARDRRFRIEHAQHIAPADVPRFRELNVIASMQPYHAIDDGRWAEKLIGAERAHGTYAFRSLLDAGARVAFGSDWYVAPPTPLEGIYAAVTRRTLDDANPDGWVPEQKITVEEALAAYTREGAYASFEEELKGTLQPGRLADIVVVDRNLLRIPPEQIRDARVTHTIVGGTVVHGNR